MSAIFDQQNPYGQSSGYGGATGSSSTQGGGSNNLQFYSGGGGQYDGGYGGSGGVGAGSGMGGRGRTSLEGNMTSGYGSSAADRSLMNSQMGFWSAFGTGGFPDEPSLMEGE